MSCPITGELNCKCEDINKMIMKPTLKDTLRKLFTDYAIYIKFYITSENFNLTDKQLLIDRLSNNQKDIGDFIKPLIGETNGDNFTKILKEHLNIVIDAIKSIKSNDKIRMEDSVKDLYSNCCKLSKFLSSLNEKKLPYDIIFYHLNKYNQNILILSSFDFQKKCEESLKKFDAFYNQTLLLADMLCLAFTNEHKQSGGNKTDYLYKYKKYKTKYLNGK